MSRLDVTQRTLLEIETVIKMAQGMPGATKQELIKELLVIINKYYE